MREPTYDNPSMLHRPANERRPYVITTEGRVYGPTHYQISVWENEGGCSLDPEDDPLRDRQSLWKRTYKFITRRMMSF